MTTISDNQPDLLRRFLLSVAVFIITTVVVWILPSVLRQLHQSAEVHFTVVGHFLYAAVSVIEITVIIACARQYMDWRTQFFTPIWINAVCLGVFVVFALSFARLPKVPMNIFDQTSVTTEVREDGRIYYLYSYPAYFVHNHNYINYDGNSRSGWGYEDILYECDMFQLVCKVISREPHQSVGQ